MVRLITKFKVRFENQENENKKERKIIKYKIILLNNFNT
jgi:hypothetical protein